MNSYGLRSFVFQFLLKSRTIGTLLAAVISGVLLAYQDNSLYFSIGLPFLWIWVLFIGAKSHFLLWFVLSSDKAPRTSLDWDKGVASVLLLTLGISLLRGSADRPFSHFHVLWIFLSLTYGLNKISCWKYGCCHWNENGNGWNWVPAIPLPLLEAFISLGAGVFLIFLFLWNSDDLLAVRVFAASHLLARMANHAGRFLFSSPGVRQSQK